MTILCEKTTIPLYGCSQLFSNMAKQSITVTESTPVDIIQSTDKNDGGTICHMVILTMNENQSEVIEFNS